MRLVEARDMSHETSLVDLASRLLAVRCDTIRERRKTPKSDRFESCCTYPAGEAVCEPSDISRFLGE